MTPLTTPLCDLLNIDYPIVQSGMSRVAGPELVAAVSNAGGFGILAALRLTAGELRAQVRRIRELTDRPFGVNLWLHPAVVSPADPAAIPDHVLSAVQGTLNEFRGQLGIPQSTTRPAPFPRLVAESFEVIVEERVAVWSIGLGVPEAGMVARCHDRNIRVMAMVTTVEDAKAVEAVGVDMIVAQGGEAGGHQSRWRPSAGDHENAIGTMVVVPQVVDAVRVPVIAAGGIADGRGIVAALALGAAGVMLGTRFIVAREAIAPRFFKDAVLEARSTDTVTTAAFTGLPMRGLRNRFANDYARRGAPVLPGMLQSNAAEDVYTASAQRGDREYFPLPAGQSAGLVRDAPSGAEIVARLVEEARTVLEKLPR